MLNIVLELLVVEITRQPYLDGYKFIEHDLSNVDHIHDFGLYIGNHPELVETDIVKLCEELNNL